MGNLAEASPTPDDPSPTTGASPTEGANLLPPKPKLHGDPMYQPIKEMLRRALVQAPEKEAFITGLHHRVQQYALGTDANVRSAEALLRSAAKHLADNIGLERCVALSCLLFWCKEVLAVWIETTWGEI